MAAIPAVTLEGNWMECMGYLVRGVVSKTLDDDFKQDGRGVYRAAACAAEPAFAGPKLWGDTAGQEDVDKYAEEAGKLLDAAGVPKDQPKVYGAMPQVTPSQAVPVWLLPFIMAILNFMQNR